MTQLTYKRLGSSLPAGPLRAAAEAAKGSGGGAIVAAQRLDQAGLRPTTPAEPDTAPATADSGAPRHPPYEEVLDEPS